ncbi:hypothetical protein TBLA_0A08660 [Henningerozyma blattae CBS 6284]|uniref:Tyrosine-protein phosphatase OCA6 n=1 Tax=Henningerozyma blattae (strain ATCC 34711 / CBS 6284 / DSM 70876 / NBRC 10599 / NRRL Y-10934 / UCD 77-7) TaxID=1071380 RepID=I2GX03_HENB6|nr:hypothetical protein TBLA_0A08660 [Tetrapisispora blattae CBS 6284]CCH58655.1 hypothetical protein TBLA_0A08660 [Tetrapisispora blattae CBS 6284]
MSIVTPLLFATVQPNLYRGSYPHSINFDFLKSLNLKCIISLLPNPITEDFDYELFHFAKQNNIQLIHFYVNVKLPNTIKDRLYTPSIQTTTTNDDLTMTDSSLILKKQKDKEKKKKVKRKLAQVPLDYTTINQIITFLCNKKNYPIYLHCTNGELICSLVVACLRKFTYWSNVSILNEFLIYNSSINIYERSFIENFDTNPNSVIDWNKFNIQDKIDWLNKQYLKRDI